MTKNKTKAIAALSVLAVMLSLVVVAPLASVDGTENDMIEIVKYDSDVAPNTITMKLDPSFYGAISITCAMKGGIFAQTIAFVERGEEFPFTSAGGEIAAGIKKGPMHVTVQEFEGKATSKDVGVYSVTFMWDGQGTSKTVLLTEDSLSSHEMPAGTWTQNGRVITDLSELTFTDYSATLHNAGSGPYPVTFNMNGHGYPVPAAQTVAAGGKVKEPTPAPYEAGYTFGGWYKDSALAVKWDFATDTVSGPTTLYANWTADKYTVTFDMNGHGSPVPTAQTHGYGEKVDMPVSPKETGFKFAGWYADPALLVPWDFDNDVVVGDMTLYAKWEDVILTVAFDLNGHGEMQVKTQTVKYGDKINYLKPVEPEGWSFVAWCTDSKCAEVWPPSNPVTEDMTLYARWSQNTCTVHFAVSPEGHGAVWPSSVSAVIGETVIKPSITTDPGYSVARWYDKATGQTWDFAKDVVLGEMTIVAELKYTPGPTPTYYTVTFEMNGHGSQIPSQVILAGGKVTKPANPTASGYVFAGWYSDPALLVPWDFDSDVVVGDMTLYAYWIEAEQSCTVTFDMNGHGKQVDTQIVKKGGKVTKPADPTASGWKFKGWCTDKPCTAAWDFGTPVAGDMTLYAKWEEEKAPVVDNSWIAWLIGGIVALVVATMVIFFVMKARDQDQYL